MIEDIKQEIRQECANRGIDLYLFSKIEKIINSDNFKNDIGQMVSSFNVTSFVDSFVENNKDEVSFINQSGKGLLATVREKAVVTKPRDITNDDITNFINECFKVDRKITPRVMWCIGKAAKELFDKDVTSGMEDDKIYMIEY